MIVKWCVLMEVVGGASSEGSPFNTGRVD